MAPERAFKVEITATRIMEITVGGDLGITVMDGEDVADAVEIAARENLFFTQNAGAVRDIQGWDVNIDTVIEVGA